MSLIFNKLASISLFSSLMLLVSPAAMAALTPQQAAIEKAKSDALLYTTQQCEAAKTTATTTMSTATTQLNQALSKCSTTYDFKKSCSPFAIYTGYIYDAAGNRIGKTSIRDPKCVAAQTEGLASCNTSANDTYNQAITAYNTALTTYKNCVNTGNTAQQNAERLTRGKAEKYAGDTPQATDPKPAAARKANNARP